LKYFFITIFAIFTNVNSFADGVKGELSEKFNWLAGDFVNGFGFFTTQNIFVTTAFVSSSVLSSVMDEEVRKGIQDKKTEFLDSITDVANEFGSATYVVPASLGLYGISLFTGNQKFSDASFTAWESLVVSGLITRFLKYSAGRARPFQEKGNLEFLMFSGKQDSLPSGHTTVAFAFITPYAEYLGAPYSYFLYFFAASTAFARIYRDVHWLSDVVAGAGVGYITGKSLVELHKKRRDYKVGFLLDFEINKKIAGLSVKF